MRALPINKKIQLITDQLSYNKVYSSLLFLLVSGVILYVTLVIMSTAMISHSKVLSENVRETQSELTRINGKLSLKKQNLAMELQDNEIYVNPSSISYVKKDFILGKPLALEN